METNCRPDHNFGDDDDDSDDDDDEDDDFDDDDNDDDDDEADDFDGNLWVVHFPICQDLAVHLTPTDKNLNS